MYIDKAKLLKWIKNEIGQCNAAKHEDDKAIKWECERIVERINAGLFDANKKQISDGYHTFEELYYHRMILFSIICNAHKDKAWKSWKHHDGTMFDDSFIVGIETPEGQYTYHYDTKYWDVFKVGEMVSAPEYDGHKPKDITRLLTL